MITLIIHHTTNDVGLAALLVNLQPQLHPDDDIYIVDSSPNRSGLEIAKKYGSTRCLIFVEVGDVPREVAWEYGIQSMRENNQEGALILDEACLCSATFIASLKRSKLIGKDYDVLTPRVFESLYERLDSNFSWFNLPSNDVKEAIVFPTKCFYVTKEGWDKEGKKIGCFPNEIVAIV